MLIPLNDTGRHRKGRAAAAAPPKFSAKGVTKVKSHGVYELKPSIVAKSTQVTVTPSLGQTSLDFTEKCFRQSPIGTEK